MLYSKILAKFAISILTLSLLAACGGAKDADTPQNDDPVSMVLSGSVGDGPIVGATITLEDANGSVQEIAGSDDAATYQADLQLREGQYPLIIKAEGGTDLVTNTSPDFTLYSVVLNSSSQERISNINPHSTLITKTAQNLAGGITTENLSSAQEVVLHIFGFGLNPQFVFDPIESEITADNAANISKSSEILGEMIRRTRNILNTTGANVSGDDVVDAIAADLIDGKLDGLGGEHASKVVAAVASLVSGQVLLEASANRLYVNNSLATSAMDDAIVHTRPSATVLTGDVMITAAMLEQIKNIVNSAASITPSPMLNDIIDKLSSISGEQHPSEFSNVFPVEVSGGFSSIIQHASQATESELDAINSAINLQTKPNEPGRFAFGAASYSVDENGGVVEITINRLGGNDGAVTIDWMTEGVTATFAQDYGNFNWTTLSFADGETSKTETISIVNDSLVEEDEVFNVLLGNPTGGASIGAVATTAVTIVNDDSAPVPQPGSVEFAAASYSVDENGGVVEITINRLGGNDGAVTIDWMTEGVTATFAQDYGNFNWTTLSFADGETSKTETISIVNDSLVEEDEVFNVLLGNPTGGASIGSVATTAVTIVNDDSAPVPQPGSVEFAAASYSVNENGGVVEITINRLGGSDGVVTIDWMTEGVTATFAQDYGNFNWTTLSFADGETSKTETISIVNDSLVEEDEVFNVLLGNPTGGASIGSVATTAVTIVNDDSAPVPQPGSVEFGAASYSVDENGGVVEITINRLDGSDGAVTIDWMTEGVTATSAQDYGDFNWTTLSFADGETSKTETISIVNDSLVEEDEVFNVLLGNPTGGASIGAVATTAVTIVNDDSAPVPQPGSVEFAAASYSVDENGGVVEITINRLDGSDGAITIDWMTEGVTATFAQDYGNFNWTTLSFADGETSKTETISIVNDSLVEEDEVFNVLLGNPTGGASVGGVATAAVTIVNDDSSTPVVLSVLSTSPSSQAYTVQLSENIVIEFDDTLDCQTVNSQAIILTGNSGDVSALITCADATVTLDPVENLMASTAYTATVLSSVASTSGYAMGGSYSWSFTTLAGEALPMLGEWESKMLADGEHWGQYLTNLYPPIGSFNEQSMTYYDSQRVFYQIADYTGQSEPWHTYALEAKRVYMNYAENSVNNSGGYNFSFPGYRRFAQGIYMEYVRTGDSAVYENIAKIRDNPAISEAGDRSISIPAWYWERRSREVAYALEAHIFAERAGYPRDEADVARYVSMALNHIKEWTSGEFGYTASYRRAPFMFALTAEALIIFYEWELENGRDPAALYNHSSVPAEFVPTIMIPEAIKSMADYLYDEAVVISGDNVGKRMWVEDLGGSRPNWNDEGGSGYSTFRYEDIKSGAPTIDLNLLIAPAYAWLFQHYGDMKYINIADRLFTSGVSLSNTGWNTKIFNQNYRWSFDYVKWRNEGFAKMK